MAGRIRSLKNHTRKRPVSSVEVTRYGLAVHRFFSAPEQDPLDTVEWVQRHAVIRSEDGKVIFEQSDVEAPASWSDMAVNVVVSRYFRGVPGSPDREKSIKHLILRVVDTIYQWGLEQRYFRSEEDARIFRNELLMLLLHQKATFNSPVWFNLGVDETPQCSACFILSVEDTMESILEWYRQEGMIFKSGSGAGINVSSLRSAREALGGGGTASGPVSFMKAADASAGVIKSGGKTRRAAKMVIMDVDHPDIMEFIRSKAQEEAKAHALVAAGFGGPSGRAAYGTVAFQNSNHSVRAADEFMEADRDDGTWTTHYVLTGEEADRRRARDIMAEIARAAHFCGDPGMQFHSTINRWHTCPNTAPIRASNPCSEYMHVDDSACNLSSLKLTAFLEEDRFPAAAFRHAVDVMITAQDILVDRAGYPTEKVAANARSLRALGLGYADLGSLLMRLGLPYDSDEGRSWASYVTSLMCGEAYLQSARIAAVKGPFTEFEKNREPMLNVIGMHRDHTEEIPLSAVPKDLAALAREVWNQAVEAGEKHGYRNCQVTVLAPTGTIGFMMDCDTTGIEPELSLMKFKSLSEGGHLKIVNRTVPRALERLGYSREAIRVIVSEIEHTGTIEGIGELKPEHLPVFDCAFRPTKGKRFIAPEGHLRMVAAVQRFISGAISKTINLPNETTSEQIEEIYRLSWRLELKAVSIYRDGCKMVQPVSQSAFHYGKALGPVRRRLPIDCKSVRHKFEVAGQKGYIHAGFYEDGTVGEIFIRMAKEGSTISGLMDTIATLTSIALQYGVPLEALVNKFIHVRFEPSGFTSNPEIPIAKSLTDYIFRFLGLRFLSPVEQETAGLLPPGSNSVEAPHPTAPPPQLPVPESQSSSKDHAFRPQSDAPACQDCGAIMVRSGSCYHCLNCGASNGCS